MLPSVVAALACPVCGRRMSHGERTLVCEVGHTLDLAKQGYAPLLGSGRRGIVGDTAEMVAARAEFLATGHYAPLASAIADTVPDVAGLVLDVAGGTGYYLAAMLDRHPRLTGLGLDLSPYAARRAAKAHERADAATADAWSPLPLQDGSVAVALSVFGPRNGAELARVLAPSGVLVVAAPTPRHLRELRGPLGLLEVDPQKDERLAASLAAFRRVGDRAVEYSVIMDETDVTREVRMGPSAHHVTSAQVAERLGGLVLPVEVTVSVVVSSWVVAAQGAEPRDEAVG
jgi:23S rRNA (guanine745-N1)-methyltransferase